MRLQVDNEFEQIKNKDLNEKKQYTNIHKLCERWKSICY